MSKARFVAASLSSLAFASLAHAHAGRPPLPALSEAAVRNTILTMKILAPLPEVDHADVQQTAKSWLLSKVPSKVTSHASLYFGKSLAK